MQCNKLTSLNLINLQKKSFTDQRLGTVPVCVALACLPPVGSAPMTVYQSWGLVTGLVRSREQQLSYSYLASSTNVIPPTTPYNPLQPRLPLSTPPTPTYIQNRWCPIQNIVVQSIELHGNRCGTSKSRQNSRGT